MLCDPVLYAVSVIRVVQVFNSIMALVWSWKWQAMVKLHEITGLLDCMSVSFAFDAVL